MNTHIGMKNGTVENLINKYIEVRNDLIENSRDLMNRYEYYSKKYRGNRLEDVNVGLTEEPNHKFTAQVFLRTRENKYMRERITFTFRGEVVREETLTNVKELM